MALGFLTGKNKRHDVQDYNRPWCDIHSHFLPAIDDGCKNVKESIMLLHESRKQGVIGMIATPHYYPKETVESFLIKRQKAAENLKNALAEVSVKVPAWCMGAEVAYFHGLVNCDNVEELCLGKSKYMLLELPFASWDGSIIRDINILSNMYDIMPIIAHLERFLSMQSREIMEQLSETDTLFQMNGEYILDKHSLHDAKKRINHGLVQVLGSDSHNLNNRRPNIKDAVDVLLSEGLEDNVETIRQMNIRVFKEAYEE